MSERKPSGNWTTCRDCHRVLWVEHGPVCPECLAKRKALSQTPTEPTADMPAAEAPLVLAEGEIMYQRRRRRASKVERGSPLSLRERAGVRRGWRGAAARLRWQWSGAFLGLMDAQVLPKSRSTGRDYRVVLSAEWQALFLGGPG